MSATETPGGAPRILTPPSQPTVRDDHLPANWYRPTDRVPRQGQDVRIWTRRGVDRVARFSVTHTDDWPSGASWIVGAGLDALPFEAVEGWSPDPETAYPTPRSPVPHPVPAEPAPEAPEPAGPPAILREVVAEVGLTGDVLRRLPATSLDWSPHPSIPSLHVLALRLVRLVARIEWVMDLDSVELLFEPDLPHLAEPDEILATFAANAKTVGALADRLTADDLRAPWALERDGQPVARLPRGDALRQFGLSPLVYHRGEAALLMTALGARVPPPCPLWTFSEPGADWSGPALEEGEVGPDDA